MARPKYMTAQEAARILDVKRETLYAYVSRGLIRSEQSGSNHKSRRYHAEDVERLSARKTGRSDPASAAEQALHVGSPVMDSSISMITDECTYYRGYDALKLAATRSVEEVAALIWLEDLDAALPDEPIDTDLVSEAAERLKSFEPVPRIQALLPLLADGDIVAFDLRKESVIRTGYRILRSVVALLARNTDLDQPIARTLATAWTNGDDSHTRLLSATLTLSADHELNTSTFAARCAASVGASPYDVVAAGLATFVGPLHGGACRQAERFIREMAESGDVTSAIEERLRRRERIPGFGHVLYRNEDPRATLLIDLIDDTVPDHPAVTAARSASDLMQRRLHLHHNIDYAIALLSVTLDLPQGTSTALFATGRIIGWIGHAIEQYAVKPIIRPRARYVGRLPETS